MPETGSGRQTAMTDTAETFHFRPGGRIEQRRGGVGFAPGEAERLRERCFLAGPGPKYAKQSQFVDSGDAPRRHGDRREGYNYITGKRLYATLCVLCDSVVNRVRPTIGDCGLGIRGSEGEELPSGKCQTKPISCWATLGPTGPPSPATHNIRPGGGGCRRPPRWRGLRRSRAASAGPGRRGRRR